MATNQRRRQKKLERRTAQRKQRHRELQKAKHRSLAERLADIASSPILHCCATQALWDQGISNVLISREISSGMVGAAVFLVDRYCLGVKDAFGRIVPRSEYRTLYEQIGASSPIVPLQPADVRKLVEGAVDYAEDIGLAPHRDYHKVKTIFGDIDPNESTQVFEYGRANGKPHFIAGPNDSPFRCSEVMDTLRNTCGPDGFHFTVPVHPDMDGWDENLTAIESEDSEDHDREEDDWEDDWEDEHSETGALRIESTEMARDQTDKDQTD